MTRLPKDRQSASWTWAEVLTLCLVSGLAYLLWMDKLGYYRDDFNLIFAGISHGPRKFIDMYSVDRPFVGYMFSAIYSALGNRALHYVIAGYVFRLLGGLGLLWLVRMLWPHQRLATLSMAALFLTYPGFLQQPNTIQYQPHIINLTVAVASLALTVRALRSNRMRQRALLVALSVIFGLWSMLIMEYFIGFEGFRLVVIWILLRDGRRIRAWPHLKQVVRIWWPFGVTLVGFLLWRFAFFENASARPTTDMSLILTEYLQSPVHRAVLLASGYLKDLLEVTVGAWTIPPYLLISTARLRHFALAALVGALAMGIFLIVVMQADRKRSITARADADEGDAAWPRQAWVIGFLGVSSTILPVVFANRDVSYTTSTFDRFSLPSSAGAAILIVGSIFWQLKSSPRIALVAALLGVSVMTHYVNGARFAAQWQRTRDFWWQVSWRIPQIEPGAVLLANLPDVPIEEDYEIWGPANLIYYPQPGEIQLGAEVLNSRTVQEVLMRATSTRELRTFIVERDYARTLIVSMPTVGSCAQVIDGARPLLSPEEEFRIAAVARRSRPAEIRLEASPSAPPTDVFGAEPDHTWCFYYERAALALQREDYAEIVRLGAQAGQHGLRATDWVEWMPFLEGYAYAGEFEAVDAILPIIGTDPYIRHQACGILEPELAGDLPDPVRRGKRYIVEELCD